MQRLTRIVNWLFPSYCVCCQTSVPRDNNEPICQDCLFSLDLFDVEQSNLLHQPHIANMFHLKTCNGLMACGWYQDSLKVWLKRLKFTKQSAYQLPLKQVIEKQFSHWLSASEFKPDVIILVPLHPIRFIHRGFNQVSRTWMPIINKYDFQIGHVTRAHYTLAQSRLNKKQRQKNLKEAFILHSVVKDKKVLIIDDVITTGATVNALTKICSVRGAKEVWVFATALTQKK